MPHCCSGNAPADRSPSRAERVLPANAEGEGWTARRDSCAGHSSQDPCSDFRALAEGFRNRLLGPPNRPDVRSIQNPCPATVRIESYRDKGSPTIERSRLQEGRSPVKGFAFSRGVLGGESRRCSRARGGSSPSRFEVQPFDDLAIGDAGLAHDIRALARSVSRRARN